ncbi:hypothetical protein NK356_22615 [Chryseobacterium sp. S0630]|uniref:hypothetical protein n=1 Tax=Chryseobacterium sp. S0630 TaxID=2957803 RepID=UPI0020A1F81E|nr:hypothetical protein [Chryseobacterium sp. S0630]MCP1301968.1 hypothetical protein [Chryseobacterium sp. S0630]
MVFFWYVQKKNNEAIDAYQKSLELAKEVNRPYLVLDNYRWLATVYKDLKESEYLNKATLLKDSMDNDQSKAITLSFNKITKEKEEEKKKAKTQTALWYGGFSLALIAVLSLYFYMQIKRKKKKLLEKKKIILQQEEETKNLKRNSVKIMKISSKLPRKTALAFCHYFRKLIQKSVSSF